MRRGRDNGILLENQKVIAINLGADYCAEHEWGIKRMRAAFGMSDAGYGLERRTMSKMPTVHFIDSKKETILIMSNYFDVDQNDSKKLNEYLGRLELGRYNKDDQELKTAWDEGTFGIRAAKESDRAALREVYQAMQNKDLAIWLGGGGVFQNAGLVLAIKSRIPFEKGQMLRDADIDRENLQNAALATGIAERLEKAGKRYYALSPWWAKGRDVDTKHDVVFWLNPMEQQKYNYGCFTVEQLDQWAKNEGPIMMRSK